jgi:hypothetical protein
MNHAAEWDYHVAGPDIHMSMQFACETHDQMAGCVSPSLLKQRTFVEPREYLDILRRRWLSVLIIALATLAVASLLTLAMPKNYTATTRPSPAILYRTLRKDPISPRSRCRPSRRLRRHLWSWNRSFSNSLCR